MIIHDRAFQRSIKRAVRRRLKAQPELRKRVPKRTRQFSVTHPAVSVPVAVIMLGAFLYGRMEDGTPRFFLFLPLSLYSLHFILSRALRIQTAFLNSPERLLFRFFPFSDAQYFRWMMDSFLFRSGFYWIISATVYLVLLPQDQLWLRILFTFCGATLSWLLALTGAFLLAPVQMRVPRWLPIALSASCAVPFFVPLSRVEYATLVEWAIPFSWLARFFLDFAKIPFGWYLLVLLFGALTPACYFVFRRLQPIYEEKETFWVPPIPSYNSRPSYAQIENTTEEYEEYGEPGEATPMTDAHVQKLQEYYSSSAAAKFIRTGTSLDAWDWSKAPLLDRWCVAWLSPRERDVLEFLIGGWPPRWTNMWRFSVIAAGVAVAAALLPTAVSMPIFIIAGIVSAIAGLPLLATWTAFSQYTLTGKLSPIHSCFPLDYRETFRVIGKIAIVRGAAWLPLGLLLGAVFGQTMGGNAVGGAYQVLIGFFCLMACLPVICALHFSANTNDSHSRKFSTLVFVVAAVIYGILAFFSIIYGLTPGAPMAYLVPLILAGLSFLAWALYGRYYARGRFDLLRVPK